MQNDPKKDAAERLLPEAMKIETLNMSTSSQSSAASESAGLGAENSLATPAVSEKFRIRMQPCPEQLWQRQKCPCCGRNFRDAANLLDKFRATLLPPPPQSTQPAAAAAASNDGSSSTTVPTQDFNEGERLALLSDDFLCRLLARCQCDFKRAQERLLAAHAVHRKYALATCVGCQVCSATPGYHSFRQVGFDRLGRPVLYTCLNQDLETGNQPEQVKAYFSHLIQTVKEAEKTIREGQHSLVMVFDTTGLGLSHVRTDNVSQFGEMLKYFPARMSYSLLLNMSTVTRYLLKPIIHLTGHQEDVLMIASAGQMEKQLAECFESSLVAWMVREMERNRQAKMAFWQEPEPQAPHDPRGEPFYVENYVKKRHPSGHRPHPSIVAVSGEVHQKS